MDGGCTCVGLNNELSFAIVDGDDGKSPRRPIEQKKHEGEDVLEISHSEGDQMTSAAQWIPNLLDQRLY
uniref:Uncharacterized protein n=1 Tax=Romanomermis culicivorax TaxID=13658 RepID=A0A915I067_ROMCU